MAPFKRGAPAPAAITAPADPAELLALEHFRTLDRWHLERLARARAASAYLGQGVALCRMLGRYKFIVDTGDNGFAPHLLLDGCWEMWLTKYMAGVVAPGMTAVDVGANYGYYSVLLADLVGPAGTLVAIEPNPVAAAAARKSLSFNGFTERTTFVEAAAGADAAPRMLFVPDGEPKNATIVDAEADARAGGRAVATPGVRLDDILAGRAVDFVKIDVEGAEEDVVRGLEGVIQTHRPTIVLEFNTARYKDAKAFLAMLLGYYPQLRHVNYEGQAEDVSPTDVLSLRRGEDWLLVLAR